MKILLIDQLKNSTFSDDIWKLIVTYDYSFIPPLSARETSTQSSLIPNREAPNIKPYKYFAALKEQSCYIALNSEDKVLGFMSFRPHYICEELNDNIDTLYISTIIVDEQYRGQGITNSFYDEIEQLAANEQKPVTTRTWSTNDSHIHVLKKRGYKEALVIKDGRGPQIDTVYFRKSYKEQ